MNPANATTKSVSVVCWRRIFPRQGGVQNNAKIGVMPDGDKPSGQSQEVT